MCDKREWTVLVYMTSRGERVRKDSKPSLHNLGCYFLLACLFVCFCCCLSSKPLGNIIANPAITLPNLCSPHLSPLGDACRHWKTGWSGVGGFGGAGRCLTLRLHHHILVRLAKLLGNSQKRLVQQRICPAASPSLKQKKEWWGEERRWPMMGWGGGKCAFLRFN